MKTGEKKSSTHKSKKKHQSSGSDIEYDNGNISPLYSNWDQEMQEHLLPLQNYIIEQAKLSGCYRLGDPMDSDSLHSDSQSEHSFSGHEPDNEDSDHSDVHGDYLTHHSHNYGILMMDEYGGKHGSSKTGAGDKTNVSDEDAGGVSYYNYGMNFDKHNDKEDM